MVSPQPEGKVTMRPITSRPTPKGRAFRSSFDMRDPRETATRGRVLSRRTAVDCQSDFRPQTDGPTGWRMIVNRALPCEHIAGTSARSLTIFGRSSFEANRTWLSHFSRRRDRGVEPRYRPTDSGRCGPSDG